MDKILTLLDGSTYSESVCHHTAWIAQKLNASVEAMHVLGRREGAVATNLSGTLGLGARTALLTKLSTLDEQRAKLAQEKGHAILEDAKAILEQDGVSTVNLHLRKGDLLDAMREFEDNLRAITIGKRGEGAGFASGHLGSNLERILRVSNVPVLVASREYRPISKVLVGYDGSASAKVAIRRMSASPVFENLEICVFTAARDSVHAQKTADEVVADLRAADITASSRIASSDPEDALSRLVAEEGFDLLVMGAHGHSRIRNLIIGSTTTAMVQSVKIPVLLYR